MAANVCSCMCRRFGLCRSCALPAVQASDVAARRRADVVQALPCRQLLPYKRHIDAGAMPCRQLLPYIVQSAGPVPGWLILHTKGRSANSMCKGQALPALVRRRVALPGGPLLCDAKPAAPMRLSRRLLPEVSNACPGADRGALPSRLGMRQLHDQGDLQHQPRHLRWQCQRRAMQVSVLLQRSDVQYMREDR